MTRYERMRAECERRKAETRGECEEDGCEGLGWCAQCWCAAFAKGENGVARGRGAAGSDDEGETE